jgi:predicted RNA binding protein YcfA (HicA-like mRNA interferase family)
VKCDTCDTSHRPARSKNIRFGDLVTLVEAFGFRLAQTSGSHHIFEHPDVPELVNIQSSKGKAKPYQVRQFLELVEKYDLELGEEPGRTITSTCFTASKTAATSPTSRT